MKVIYPGPAVLGVLRGEAQLHPHLGLIQVGENELPDSPALRGAIEAGLLEDPANATITRESDGATFTGAAWEPPAAAADAGPEQPAGDPTAEDARPARRRGAKE